MGEKRPKYTIYGFTPGTSSHPQSPIGGSQQPVEVRELEELKAQVERILRGLGVRYPVRSKAELMGYVIADVPDLCEADGGKRLSLRDLVFSLRDTDFPLDSEPEAAELLAASCPVSAQAAE